MKVKIWTAKQLPIIQELFSDGRIPKAVADETLRVVSILDEYYGTERNVDNDDGGYLLVYTDCIGNFGEIERFLDKYHVRLDDMELDDTLYTGDGVTWKSVLYLVTNDYGITLIYPYRDKEKQKGSFLNVLNSQYIVTKRKIFSGDRDRRDAKN